MSTNNKPAILARKISTGIINGVKNGHKGITEKTLIARIYGLASASEVGEHPQNGMFYKFKGEFRAINKEGQEYISPVCFLPSPADGMLAAAIQAAEGNPVNFGFDFFVVPDETVAIGYTYETVPLLEIKPSDPLAALAAEVNASPLQLAAPKQPDLPGTDTGEKVADPAEASPKKGSAKK